MRIIGGAHRGRRLAAPEGRDTRPMLDRVREALFSTLTPWWKDAVILDLFAGSGSLGLEALSRGARCVRFVERNPRAAACLARNVEELGIGERVQLVRADALARASWGEERPDVVFLDPPYALLDELGPRRSLLAAIQELGTGLLAPQGVLVLHTPRRALMTQEFGSALLVRERVYGSNALWYVQRAEEDGAAPGGSVSDEEGSG